MLPEHCILKKTWVVNEILQEKEQMSSGEDHGNIYYDGTNNGINSSILGEFFLVRMMMRRVNSAKKFKCCLFIMLVIMLSISFYVS